MTRFIYFVLALILLFTTGIITDDGILEAALVLFEEGTAIGVYLGAMLLNDITHKVCLVFVIWKISDWTMHMLRK